MGLFSLSKLFGLTIRESATDGSDFTNPDADYRRLFLGEDGQLHVKDSAGTVTDIGAAAAGSVATDAIWDAAGDLAVGSGADTAARLAKGNAGAMLAMGNSAVIWNAGTSFPASKATGDRYWRTDLAMEFYWDGTRWVSTQLFHTGYSHINSISASTLFFCPVYNVGERDIWLVDATWSYFNAGTQDGSKYWTLVIARRGSGDGTYQTVATPLSGAGYATTATWYRESAALGVALAMSDADAMAVYPTKVSTPGNLTGAAGFTYRIIAT